MNVLSSKIYFGRETKLTNIIILPFHKFEGSGPVYFPCFLQLINIERINPILSSLFLKMIVFVVSENAFILLFPTGIFHLIVSSL
jgi:hypothetical protein